MSKRWITRQKCSDTYDPHSAIYIPTTSTPTYLPALIEPNKAPAVVQTTFPMCKTSRPQGDPELAADLQRRLLQARCADTLARDRHTSKVPGVAPSQFLPNAGRRLTLFGRDPAGTLVYPGTPERNRCSLWDNERIGGGVVPAARRLQYNYCPVFTADCFQGLC